MYYNGLKLEHLLISFRRSNTLRLLLYSVVTCSALSRSSPFSMIFFEGHKRFFYNKNWHTSQVWCEEYSFSFVGEISFSWLWYQLKSAKNFIMFPENKFQNGFSQQRRRIHAHFAYCRGRGMIPVMCDMRMKRRDTFGSVPPYTAKCSKMRQIRWPNRTRKQRISVRFFASGWQTMYDWLS